MLMVMVRTLGHDGLPRYELRHFDCIDEGDCIEGVASPMQPNRYDYASADEYEQAVTDAYTCGRCGEIEAPDAVVGLADSGAGRGSAPGAGELDGSGSGEGAD